MFINFKSPSARQFAVVVAANLSLVSLGMNVVWGSPMLIKLRDENQTILPQPVTISEEAWIVSIGLFTGMPALFMCGYFADNFGRKWTLWSAVIPRLITQVFVIFANDVWMVICGKAIVGVADSITLGIVTVYASESSGRKIRGASGTITQISSAIGMLLILGIGPFVSYLTINIIMLAVVIITYIPMMFIPESPYFLYLKGKTDQSIEVLTYLYGSEELAHEEFKLYASEKNISSSKDEKSIESGVDKEPSKWGLLKDKTVLKSLAITLFIPFGCQLAGSTVVNMYLQTVLELAETAVSSEISSLVIGLIQLFACSVTFFITDRFGRKPILCVSLIGMAIGMFGLATFLLLINLGHTVTGFLNYLPLLSLGLVIYGHNAGYGALLWILIAELLDSSLRSYGMSASILVAVSLTAAFSLTFPSILVGGSSIVFWVFGGCCILNCLFIAVLVPETKGKTFVEIQRAFGRKMIDVDTKPAEGKDN